MNNKEFSEKFEEYLIKFTNSLIEDIEARRKKDFKEGSNKIFDFLSKGYLGNLSEKERAELFLENQEMVASQYFRLYSKFSKKI